MNIASLPLPGTAAWKQVLYYIINYGEEHKPRGFTCQDLRHATVAVDMMRPAVIVPERGLSQKFQAAEAYWILSGDHKAEGIVPWNSRISEFSDDGATFFGAYGPKVVGQIDYVVKKLQEDPDTRQAGLTIWRENPPKTRDYPCTIAMWFRQRGWFLDCHTFMRSSDAWLGFPYDIFNFSMVTALVCAKLNEPLVEACVLPTDKCTLTVPGTLHLTMASSHLYERNLAAVHDVAYSSAREKHVPCRPIPLDLLTRPGLLLDQLKTARDLATARFWLPS